MSPIISFAKRTTLIFAAVLVTLFFPVMVSADTAGGATGPQQPTGADGKTFHLNPQTGKWENEHYIWDPVTKQTTLKNPAYSYNPETKKWDTESWHYDAPAQRYEKVVQPAPQPPDEQNTTAQNNAPAENHSTATGNSNSATATSVANGVTSTAVSGNATVANNTHGGSATSGDATAISTTLNMLQSGTSFGANGAIPVTFSTDITQDIDGDIVLDPSLFTLQPAQGSTNGQNTTNLSVQNDAAITNTISLSAASGTATVDSNTEAGNATSGTANAVANVINMANSAISSSGSFLGLINIYSNVNGDILLPPGVIEQILDSNAPTMTLDTSTIENGDLIASFTNNQSITNNVNAYAASGNATVAGNTTAGSAQSGTASTNITVFNMTGREVVGDNCLLVFVNVLGRWTGLILDRPAGTTAAALGDGTATYNAANIEGDSTAYITNNIDVSATTGDAAVINNTQAGNATSGDASASVNLLNVSNSSMSLTGWFGLLFINVFGSWNGSFGVDTKAGEPPTATPHSPNANPSAPAVAGESIKVFQLVANQGNHKAQLVSYEQAIVPTVSSEGADQDKAEPNIMGTTETPTTKTKGNDWSLVIAGVIVAACLLAIERFHALRSHKAKV
jgi:hypothetical protein